MQSWVQVLPAPGPMVGAHQTYIIDPAAPQQVLENTKLPLPVSIEFNHFNGVVGWVRELRLNEDQSIDGLLDWTNEGLKYLAEQGGGYTAPALLMQPNDSAATRIVDVAVTQHPMDARRMKPIPVMPQGMLQDELQLLVKQTARRLGLSEAEVLDRARGWIEETFPE